jgi:hypothetical protein
MPREKMGNDVHVRRDKHYGWMELVSVNKKYQAFQMFQPFQSFLTFKCFTQELVQEFNVLRFKDRFRGRARVRDRGK